MKKEAEEAAEKARLEAIAEAERIAAEKERLRLEAIVEAERLRLAELVRIEKARLDAISQSQADALGLKSLQQIMEEASAKAADEVGFVSMRISPRGLRVGFPLLEPPPPARSWSAPVRQHAIPCHNLIRMGCF